MWLPINSGNGSGSCSENSCFRIAQVSGAKKDPQNQKFARTAPKNFLNNLRALPVIIHKTRVLRQIAPESSPERSAKSLSHSFFVVPFLSPKVVRCHSENGILILHSENQFLNSESCSENTPELSESFENGLVTPRAFS